MTDRSTGFEDWGDHRPQRHKKRYVLFSPKDEAMFSEALRQAFPTVKYVIRSGGVAPPSCLDAFDSLMDVTAPWLYIVVPSSLDWQPIPGFDSEGRWIEFKNIPRHSHLTYYRPQWYEGEIFGSYEPWNPEHEAFLNLVRTVWRIIERLATNRYKHGHPLGNKLMGREVQLMKDAWVGRIWLGHCALEWCNADPSRMLAGAYRACDDWQVPQTRWYQALRAQVDERFGLTFDDRPPLS